MTPDTHSQVIEAAYLHRRATHVVLIRNGEGESYGAALIFRFSTLPPLASELHPAAPLAGEPDWPPLMANIAHAYYLGLGVLAADHLNLNDPRAFSRGDAVVFKMAASTAVYELMKTPLQPNASECQKVRIAQRQLATVVDVLHQSVSRHQCMAMGLPVPKPAHSRVRQSVAKHTPLG